MSDDDLIRRGDALRNALAYATGEGAAKAELAIRALPAVQPDAAAIREAALREASEIAAQEGWPSSMSDAEYEAMTGIEEGSMNCATRIEAAILALIDTGKEVMPLDAGTTETQTQAHDIGPGDQAVAGAAPVTVPDYDAGLLNDFGGGNVEWWQDYIRAEIGRANDYWRSEAYFMATSKWFQDRHYRYMAAQKEYSHE
jgi:hypothetical protein